MADVARGKPVLGPPWNEGATSPPRPAPPLSGPGLDCRTSHAAVPPDGLLRGNSRAANITLRGSAEYNASGSGKSGTVRRRRRKSKLTVRTRRASRSSPVPQQPTRLNLKEPVHFNPHKNEKVLASFHKVPQQGEGHPEGLRCRGVAEEEKL